MCAAVVPTAFGVQPTTDPNVFTDTALSVAIKKGNLRMVHLLMKNGAMRKHKVACSARGAPWAMSPVERLRPKVNLWLVPCFRFASSAPLPVPHALW